MQEGINCGLVPRFAGLEAVDKLGLGLYVAMVAELGRVGTGTGLQIDMAGGGECEECESLK